MADPPIPKSRGGAPLRYHIETWGCQMNVHDSEKLAGALEEQGFLPASSADEADLVLLNTCAIREKAEEKAFSEIGRLRPVKRRRSGAVIAVCGCVAQEHGERIFERAPHVDLVVGPRASASLPRLALRLLAGDGSARHSADLEERDDSIRFPFDRIRREGTGPAKAFVTVSEGCNRRCAYCVVPRTRGREICRDLDDVLAEVRFLAGRGTAEVEFLGQTVNAYRDAKGRDLADLLAASSRVEGVRRIRFTTSHPSWMTERIVDAMADSGAAVCPYLHLPVQSGSSRVLSAMRRGYDRDGYLATIAAVRRRIPGISFGSDVIVGFPAESPADFEETLSLLADVRFDTVYSFAYSPRPGTDAFAQRDDVQEGEKLLRLARLQALQKEIQQEANRAWIGRTVEVLVEGPSKRDRSEWTGRTPENRVVNFAGPAAPGRSVSVRVTRSSAFSLHGEAESASS